MRRLTLSSATIGVVIIAAAILGTQSVTYGSVISETYYFRAITNNNPPNAAIGESQFSVEVFDIGTFLAEFRFTNVGSEASSITDIYFDDNANLLRRFGVGPYSANPGVSFSEGADPGNLPAGALLPIPFIADFSAGADDPEITNGIDPGEHLNILLEYTTAEGFSEDAFAVLADAIENNRLRIGLFAQGFDSGGSESFVTVPEPCSTVLVSLGIITVGTLKRRMLM